MSLQMNAVNAYRSTPASGAQTAAQAKGASASGTTNAASNGGITSSPEGLGQTKGNLLIPTTKEGYGTVIGQVELSEKAQKYYDQLKSKFHNMDFILVSKDLKSQVASRASAYGNANKPVVLIDDEKIERMANDEAFRKKYEGIIAMSQNKLMEAKNRLTSSGANVKNFDLSVGEDGKASFFATLEKSGKQQAELRSKQLAKKKEAKAAAEKKQIKEKAEQKLAKEKLAEKKQAETAQTNDNKMSIKKDAPLSRDFVEFRSDDLDDLVSKVSDYAYRTMADNIKLPQERMVGQSIDFKG